MGRQGGQGEGFKGDEVEGEEGSKLWTVHTQ